MRYSFLELDMIIFYTIIAGIFYSIGVLFSYPINGLWIHFAIFLFVVCLCEIVFISHKYLKRKYMSDRMKTLVGSMKVE